MSWVDNFNLILHIDKENTITLNSTNYLTSLEFTSQLNSAASSYDAAPFSNSILFGIDYDPNILSIYKGQKVELFNGEVRLGVFYVNDSTQPDEDHCIATITAYDLFYNLINQNIVPDFEILDGVDVKTYIKQVFDSVGIEESRILISDDVAANALNYSICDGKTLADILKEFCLATDTFVYVDADENIRVIPKEIIVEGDCDELNDDLLYGLELGTTFEETQTGIKLIYNRLTVGNTEEILRTETTLQPSIMTELTNIKLENPLYQIDHITTSCSATLNSIKASQNQLDVYLTSDMSEEETAEVVVYGRLIKFVESYVEKEENSDNPNVKSISTQLIQDTSSAQLLLSLLYNRMNKRSLIGYIMPDNFDIELCKIFRVSSNIKYLSPIYAYVHGFKLSIVEGEVDLQILMKEIKGVEVNG